MARRLVIFDLDETLVHATTSQLPVDHQFQVAEYFIYKRPFVSELLEYAAANFDIAVWSSSSSAYVQAVVEKVFNPSTAPKFAWSVDKCIQKVDLTSNGYVYIKDLRKVQSHGYPVEQITIVDDSPEKICRQPRCHIRVSPFLGDLSDRELLNVKVQLEALIRPAP
jgi:carboxy-terminal domain RNA polymerase II polypeptide A small phosphatase